MSKWIVESISNPGIGSMKEYETVTLIPVADTFDVLDMRITCKREMYQYGVEYNLPIGVMLEKTRKRLNVAS